MGPPWHHDIKPPYAINKCRAGTIDHRFFVIILSGDLFDLELAFICMDRLFISSKVIDWSKKVLIMQRRYI